MRASPEVDIGGLLGSVSARTDRPGTPDRRGSPPRPRCGAGGSPARPRIGPGPRSADAPQPIEPAPRLVTMAQAVVGHRQERPVLRHTRSAPEPDSLPPGGGSPRRTGRRGTARPRACSSSRPCWVRRRPDSGLGQPDRHLGIGGPLGTQHAGPGDLVGPSARCSFRRNDRASRRSTSASRPDRRTTAGPGRIDGRAAESSGIIRTASASVAAARSRWPRSTCRRAKASQTERLSGRARIASA